MRIYFNNEIDSTSQNVRVPEGKNPIRIGRDPRNDVVLPSPYVAAEAGAIYNDGNGWSFYYLGENLCEVGDLRLRKNESVAVKTGQTIRIAPFVLRLDLTVNREQGRSTVAALERNYSELVRSLHRQLNEEMNRWRLSAEKTSDVDPSSEDYILALERKIEDLCSVDKQLRCEEGGESELLHHVAGRAVRSRIIRDLIDGSGEAPADGLAHSSANWRELRTAVPPREKEFDSAVADAREALKLAEMKDLSGQTGRVAEKFWTLWPTTANKLSPTTRRYLAVRQIKQEIKDIWYGYGPLEDLLANPAISEIMVNDSEHIFVEMGGVLEDSGRRFISDEVTRTVIERIVNRVGRRIDTSEPLVDARLLDGSRVNAVIPPLAIKGPCLTIRRFPKKRLDIDGLVRLGALTEAAVNFLRGAVHSRRNILISGGTGTGKTTLLNCLSEFIPDKERIVTIEDTAELRLSKQHVVSLETRQKNIEGAGEFTIRDLVKNALRMRPDRLIIGECRGGEALDMLQAMNTGHDGSLTTIHANNAEDVVLRLEVMVQMAADLPVDSIHRQIASAVDLIVQLRRLRDGRRPVVQIAEVVDVDETQGGIRLRNLFLLEGEERGKLLPTGFLPSFIGDLVEQKMIDLGTFLR